MNDLPMGRPTGSGPVGPDPSQAGSPQRSGYPLDTTEKHTSMRRRMDSRPVGLGSIVGFFLALMVLFILAAAVAQFAVRGGSTVEAPPVTQDQTPAQPLPQADGNPAGATSPDAVTP